MWLFGQSRRVLAEQDGTAAAPPSECPMHQQQQVSSSYYVPPKLTRQTCNDGGDAGFNRVKSGSTFDFLPRKVDLLMLCTLLISHRKSLNLRRNARCQLPRTSRPQCQSAPQTQRLSKTPTQPKLTP